MVRLYKIQTIRPGRARAGAHGVAVVRPAAHARSNRWRRRRPCTRTRWKSTAWRTKPTARIRTPSVDLFETETDPILIIKWKELLDMLEQITDACEDVANVIEGVVVKHG